MSAEFCDPSNVETTQKTIDGVTINCQRCTICGLRDAVMGSDTSPISMHLDTVAPGPCVHPEKQEVA